MIDHSLLPKEIQAALRQHGLTTNDIRNLSAEDVFDIFIQSKGFYGPTLRKWMDAAKAAELNKEPSK